MLADFIHELEALTSQKINPVATQIGQLISLNETVAFHFIELNKLNKDLDLPSWKTTHGLENTISIFENEWIEKKTIVLSRIKSKLGLCTKIYARKTVVVKLNRLEAFEFLNQHHSNTALKAKYNFALMYNNEVVALAAFGPIMHKKTEGNGAKSGELIRFCNKLDFTVVGGLSKLLKHFITQYQVDDVMTYIDKDWSDGKGFKKLGFEVVGEKHEFPHYVDVTKHQFAPQNTESITIYKSGLIKLLLKVRR